MWKTGASYFPGERPSGSGGGQRPENQLGASRRRYPRLVVPLLTINNTMNPKLLQLIGLAAMFDGPPFARRDTPVADENEDFHGHLDRCRQCRNNPFRLCVTGERLLKRDAAKMDGSTTGHPGGEDSRHNH